MGISGSQRSGIRRPRAVRLLGGARSDPDVCRASRGRGRDRRLASSRESSARPKRSSTSRRARSSRRRGPRPATRGIGVLASEPPRVADRSARPGRPRRDSIAPGPAAARGRTPRAIRRAARSSKPSCWASATRCAPTRASSSSARTSAARYGNAFLLLRPLLKEFGDRIMNSPIAESAVIGVCVGAALAGQRPIGEMQFNDFVATGFNQLVNNAAKIRYRWGGAVPMVLRMPWGGLRHAGPVPQPEHRELVLSHAGAQDRRAVDARGRARADGQRGRRSRSGALLRAHRALPRSARQAAPRRRGARAAADRHARRCAVPATISRSSATAPTCTPRWRSPSGSRRTASARRCSICGRSRRSTRRRSSRSRDTAAGCSSSTRTRGRAASARASRRSSRKRRSNRSTRRSGHRRARHAGPVLAAARGVLPAGRGRDRARRAPAGRLLDRRCRNFRTSSCISRRCGRESSAARSSASGSRAHSSSARSIRRSRRSTAIGSSICGGWASGWSGASTSSSSSSST